MNIGVGMPLGRIGLNKRVLRLVFEALIGRLEANNSFPWQYSYFNLFIRMTELMPHTW